jgi:hypothetical protein
MTKFDTETMAELCLKQGLLDEGLAMYRRLAEAAPDAVSRERRRRRIVELEAGGPAATAPEPAPRLPLVAPAVRLTHERDQLVFAWAVPPGTRGPALQLLLMRRTAAGGVETEARTLTLPGATGELTVVAAQLYALRAAVGSLDEGRFVPLAQLAQLPGGAP